MCGICGVVGSDDRSTLDAMASCLSHRGPDSTGTHVEDSVMLANQRLSVIDLETGDQPIYNEDGDVVVVYNGEIYNFRTLRAELEKHGHTFTTDSDTEVLVHGYEEFGAGIFERLNGMFAAAIWDGTAQRLLLGRDRAGIKPLYFAYADGRFLFASEPKSILRSRHLEAAVDTDALQYFLQLRYAPSHTSLFEGIDTVLPGHYLDVRMSESGIDYSVHEYWNPLDAGGDPPANPAAEVERTLENAVDRQLMSDVPLGFYLSGGLDTSSVVAMAAELSDEPIHTFCMGFDDQRWDERADARVVADHFDTIHHEISIEREFMQDFPEMIWHADEPKRNLYPYYVAREMRNHVTVALGGLGADELFGGYVYRYDRLAELESVRHGETDPGAVALPTSGDRLSPSELSLESVADDDFLADRLVQHLGDPARLYVLLNSTDVFADIEMIRHHVYGPKLDGEFVPADWIRSRLPGVDDLSLTERALHWDFSVKMPDDFLLVEDRMSMAHSLESRVPFLDNDLIDLAFSLPRSAKFDGETGTQTVGKTVLRDAMRDRLPDAVFQRDKQGFTMPTYSFVDEELLDHARNILDRPHIVKDGLIDGDYLDSILDREQTRDFVPHYKMLWKLVALEIWYQMYIVEDVTGPRQIEHYYSA